MIELLDLEYRGGKKRLIIYRLEKYKFHFHDTEDNEDVEERRVLGYFNSKAELVHAIEISKQNDILESEILVKEFLLDLSIRQKYIYELSYSYSILTPDNEYVDYDYTFDPQKDRKKCRQLKETLAFQEKYKFNDKKIFDPKTCDGFWIEKYKLNKLYGVIKIL